MDGDAKELRLSGEKEREFYGMYFNEYHTQKECPKLRSERTAKLFGRENVF